VVTKRRGCRRDGPGGEGEGLAGGEDGFAGGDFADAYLGAFGIEHEGDRDSAFLGGGADHGDAPGVVLVAAVGKVETGDVHAAPDERLEYSRLRC
jgi:hypothetical protein